MTARIFFKLFFTFVGLLAIAALVLDHMATTVAEEDLRRNMQRSLYESARLADVILRSRPLEEYPETVNEIADLAEARVTVIHKDGSVIADSEADPDKMENHATRPEFAEALKGRVGYSSRESATVGIEYLYAAIPVEGGALRLALPLPTIQARSQEVRLNIARVMLLALIPTMFLAAWLARRVSGRLSRIINFSEKLAGGGGLDTPELKSSGGELGELERSLATTSHRIHSMFEQLQEERSRFAAAVNGLGEGILVVERKGRVTLSNPALEKIFPEESLEIGTPLDTWSSKEVPTLFERVFEDGSWQSIDLNREDPEEKAWKVSCAPIIGRQGQVQAAVAVFYDITELEKVDRMRKDFVINVSHELRTPLTAIQGYTETLLDGALDEPEVARRFLRIIRQNTERLAQLTADLMTLSQIEVNTREFAFLPQSVTEILNQAADAIRTVTERKKISVQVEPPPDGLEVECDADAVHQILMNLLDNATKYTPEHGSISVGARAVDHEVEFYVKDTGIGIPAKHVPRLFERFYRVDKARSRVLGGTGLGLAIVKHLVLAHRGSVRVESTVGQGSTFYFRLPLQVAARQTVPATPQGVLL